jgi:hypothetical protein
MMMVKRNNVLLFDFHITYACLTGGDFNTGQSFLQGKVLAKNLNPGSGH